MQEYVPLHLHSQYSRLDGLIPISDLMKYCNKHNIYSVACTDHGNMSSAIEFYKEARDHGINPIIGQEVYLVSNHEDSEGTRWHEILLAMDNTGYRNLVTLSSLGYTDGLRRNVYPCIDDTQIKRFSLGIICLSGCISSRLSRTIMGGYHTKQDLLLKSFNALAYKQDPNLITQARSKAQSIAINAATFTGQKRIHAINQSQELHRELDYISDIIAQDGLQRYIEDLEQQSKDVWNLAWIAGKQIVESRLEVFGDRYYLETQVVPLQDQIIYNEYVRQLGKEYNIPCIVTNDSHYLHKEDSDIHHQMLRMKTGKIVKKIEKKEITEKIEFIEDQAISIMKTNGDQVLLGQLYDAIILSESSKVKTHTAAYAQRREKWTRTAQLYYLQNIGNAEDVVEEDSLPVDSIDPGRPFADWLPEFWVRTPQEMLNAGALPEELDNTVKLANRVDVKLDINTDTYRVVHMPEFDVPVILDEDGEDRRFNASDYLAYLCMEGLRDYLDLNPELDPSIYHKQLDYELRVIRESNFSNYFLIVWDYINYVRESGGKSGIGRGSSVGSIVTFLTGITKIIDPLKYPDLMFERFLTPGRPDLPDIDTDFDFDSAEKVYEYCKNKYGSDRVSKIGTFSSLGARQALQDIGGPKVLNIPFMDVQKASKFFSEFRPDDDAVQDDNKALFSINDVADKYTELGRLRDSCELNKSWFKYADGLQGIRRNASQHASGIAISSKPFNELGIPLMATYKKSSKNLVITTQYGMDDLALLGIPKFDVLKLTTLNVIEETERLIGQDFSIEDILLDDSATYNALAKGDNLGIFQMGQPKVRGDMRAIKPTSLSDIAAIITIIRPGLFAIDEESGLTMQELFKARAMGSKPVKYMFPFLEPITKSTQGILLFQESILKVLWSSGMSVLEADQLRKAMSKKQMSKAIKFKDSFVHGIQKTQNLSEDGANSLWNVLVEFASYSFCSSHAYAYGLISYWTSYLKTHYPAQFMAATLTNLAEMNTKSSKVQLPRMLEDCSQMGRSIKILPPSINHSARSFTIEECQVQDGTQVNIRFGLVGIKNVGAIGEATVAERINGPYESFEDFDTRITKYLESRPSKTALLALSYAGAFDELFSHRNKCNWVIEMARASSNKARKILFDASWNPERKAILDQKQAELCGNYYFARDNLDVLGQNVDNFFDSYKGDFVRIGGRVIEVKLDKKTKLDKLYHRIVLKTQWGNVSIDFYGNDLSNIKEKLFAGSVIIVSGKVRDENSMFGSSITLPSKEYCGEYKEDLSALELEAQGLLL